MNSIEIYFSEDDELVELNVIESECRADVIVKIGNSYYNPFIITPTRLSINFKHMMKKFGFYECRPCLVLVTDLKKETIINAILKLHENDYFSQIKPIDFEKYCSHLILEFDKWTKVY
ncbi:MAG: hypothetical protein J1F31_06835 [Erysipelotrichales bacterium]|nr:hypothetical protein [Erysipelotrichales bacterium]